MKNYPNQASSFERIRNTLQTIVDLNQQQANTLDDGILGYELAARKFYTFRGLDYVYARPQDLAARIAEEKQKPSGNQGARTNARELRRTLHDLGWVDNQGVVTPDGHALLATQPASQAEANLLATGLLQLEVADQSGTRISHPVVIMLHLLNQTPSPHRTGLELVLEANDDSPGELSRVLGLYTSFVTLPADQRAQRLHATTFQLANAIKVFPTLAKYAGLITEDAQGTYHIAPPGLQAINAPASPLPAAQPVGAKPTAPTGQGSTQTPTPTPPAGGGKGSGRRSLTRGQRRKSTEVGQHGVSGTVPSSLTPDQQAEAQNRLLERTIAHQDLVQIFAKTLGDDRGELYEDQTSFDLLWKSDTDNTCHIFEMKTIQGDADPQMIRAVGQLSYYAYFNVQARFPGAPVTKTVVVDADLHDDLGDFLESLGIGAVKQVEGQPALPLNSLGQKVLGMLPLSSNVPRPFRRIPV
jgi:hypothetical protein